MKKEAVVHVVTNNIDTSTEEEDDGRVVLLDVMTPSAQRRSLPAIQVLYFLPCRKSNSTWMMETDSGSHPLAQMLHH